jgi:hypothetical protein
MSRRRPQGTTLQPFIHKTLKIVTVLEVKRKWIETLTTVVHKDHFPSGGMPVPFNEALNEFNKTSFSSGGHSSGDNNSEEADEEEPPDIELFMAQSGTQKDDAFFDIASESRFLSLKKMIGIDAKCLCEFNVALRREVNGKRVRVEPLTRHAIVQGYFPTLSTSCRFDVSGEVAGRETVAGYPEQIQLVRTTRQQFYILPSATQYAQIGDFVDMLLHGPRMQKEHIQYRVRDFFPAIYKLPEPDIPAGTDRSQLSFVTYDSMMKLYDDNEVLDNPAQAVRDGCEYKVWFNIEELRRAIVNKRKHDFSLATIESDKAFFSTAWFFLFGKEMRLIAEVYSAGRRWQEVAARGPKLISKIFDMLVTEPYVLCFWDLKRNEALRLQKALKGFEDIERQPGGNAYKATLLRRERAALHCLTTLNELSFKNLRFVKAEGRKHGQWKLEVGDRQLVEICVDVYGFMKMSMQMRDELIFDDDHQGRLDNSVHIATGHMYTVFDNSPLTELEQYDAAAARGTLWLGPPDVEAPKVAPRSTLLEMVARNPTSVPEQFRPPQARRESVDDDNDTFSVSYVPSVRPFQTMQQADVNRVLNGQAAQHQLAPPQYQRSHASYFDVLQRLSTVNASVPQLMAAIAWLVKQKVVVRETMTGTGPNNTGQQFDAFYITSVFKSQERSVKILSDIYRRGVRSAVSQSELATDYDVVACESVAKYKDRMRTLLKSLSYKHIALINDERDLGKMQFNANDIAAQARFNEVKMKIATSLAALVEMACKLEKSLTEFLGNAPAETSEACGKESDEFAEYMPRSKDAAQRPDYLQILYENCTEEEIARNLALKALVEQEKCLSVPGKGFPRRTWFRLLKRASAVGRHDNPFLASNCIPEQQRAIDGALASPIYVITGRGGTGKTFAVERYAENLVPCQTLFVAQTGRVATELRRRLRQSATDIDPIEIPEAATIHSVLFRQVLHKKEQITMRAMLERLAKTLRDSEEHTKIIKVRQLLFDFCGGCKNPSPYDGKRALVIEEMSLVPYTLFAELLASAHPMVRYGGTFLEKILTVGDINQLPPIGYGVVLRDLCRAYPACVGHLTINHRSVTNTKIFKFATDVSTGNFSESSLRVMRDFKADTNDVRIRTSTQVRLTGDETPEEIAKKRAAANDASVCCFPCEDNDLGSTIKYVLRQLGALADPPTPESIAIRHNIIMVASMNHIVERANSVVRGLYRAHQVKQNGGTMKLNDITGEAMLPPDFDRRIMIGDRIAFRNNFREVYNVPDSIQQEGPQVFVDAEDDVYDDDNGEAPGRARAVVKYTQEEKDLLIPDAGSKLAIDTLNGRAFATGLVTTYPTKTVIIQFNNGEPLLVAGAYNRPSKTTALTACACGMHPPQQPGEPFTQHECVSHPQFVPILRRTIVDYEDRSNLQWHDQGVDYRDKSDRVRRMLIVASLHFPDLYREVDIRQHLASQSNWKFVEAETINILQGSEANIVILLVPKDNIHFACKAIYTGVTRAREQVIIIGQPRAFEAMCRRRDAVQASDFWFKLAHEASKVHLELVNQGTGQRLISSALSVRSPVAERMFLTTRAADSNTRIETWRLYDEVSRYAYQTAASEQEEPL